MPTPQRALVGDSQGGAAASSAEMTICSMSACLGAGSAGNRT